MDYRELKIFVTLADTLHFRRASQLCHVTPSTISRIIQRLEEEVGADLFIRDKKEVTITEEGEAYYQFAKDTILYMDQLKDQFQKHDPTKITGEFTIISTIGIAYGVLPEILTPFLGIYPNITPHVATGSPKRSMQSILEGEADFAILPRPENYSLELDFIYISEAPLVFAIPASWEKPNSFEEAAKLPFIHAQAPAISEQIKKTFVEHHCEQNIHSFSDSSEASLAMVAAGLGVSMLPSKMVKHSHLNDKVQIIDVGEMPMIQYGLFIKRQKYNSPVRLAFTEFVREKYGEHSE